VTVAERVSVRAYRDARLRVEEAAKAAHRKMTAADKDKLEKLCASVGVEL